MTAATIEGVKSIPSIPGRDEQYLSVNLALVPLPEVVKVAEDLGFDTELVQITYPIGGSEIHALLWSGSTNESPNDLNQRIDALADRIPTKAIRLVRGTWSKAA